MKNVEEAHDGERECSPDAWERDVESRGCLNTQKTLTETLLGGMDLVIPLRIGCFHLTLECRAIQLERLQRRWRRSMQHCLGQQLPKP